MADPTKSFEVSNAGILLEDGVHLSSGTEVPTHTADQGSFYWRKDTNDVYQQQGPGSGSNWVLFQPGGGGTGITDNRIARGDGGTGIQDSNWSIADDDLMSVSTSKNGYIIDVENTKGDGGGNGALIKAGELLGDINLRLCDANATFNILDVEADQGYIVHGKTYAQTVTDNTDVWGYDNQRTGNASYINTQLGAYRVGGELPYTELSATALTNTTSSSYVLVSGMTYTSPNGGTYIVSFSASGRGQSQDQELQVSLYSNGSKIAHTERDYGFDADDPTTEDRRFSIHTQAVITVTAGQVIQARYRTDYSTFNIFERSMILHKVHA